MPVVIINKFSEQGYAHRYLVDGSPTAADVGSQTILVGALGGGGQGMFALDITDPSQFSESNAATLSLWEFDDDPAPDASSNVRGDADLGFTYGQATIGKIGASTNAVFFGNGYNNTVSDSHVGSGHAVLYIVDVQTGVLLQKLDTSTTGTVTVAATDPPNGLSTPEVIDSDHDGIADIAYAGDLYGNLWKFRSTGSGTTWEIAYNKPLFSAAAGQAITVRPKVNVHPQGGYMVNFGTGKYIETTDNDNTSQPTQAFYGIWDKDEATLSNTIVSNDLLQQTIHEEHIVTVGSDSVTVRETSNNEPDWTHPTDPHFGWFMNLIVTGSNDNRGERVVTDPVRRNGRILFTTLLPSADRCDFGGSSWIMALDATSGKRTTISVFDINDDGYYSQNTDTGGDLVTSNTETNGVGDPIDVTISSFQPTFGIIFGPRLLAVNPYANTGNYDEVIASSISGELFSTFISSVAHTRGRKAWRQVLK